MQIAMRSYYFPALSIDLTNFKLVCKILLTHRVDDGSNGLTPFKYRQCKRGQYMNIVKAIHEIYVCMQHVHKTGCLYINHLSYPSFLN